MTIDELRAWLGTGAINIFGRPFAGKDTQGHKLAELFDTQLLGGGEILRNSVIPPHVEAALHRGELVPSEDFVSIVLPFLSSADKANKPLILSSVGRWIGEEDGVLQALERAGHPLKAVIYLDLSEADVYARWRSLPVHHNRGGRHDDTEELLGIRLEEYRRKTLPVIDRYVRLGLVERIDASAAANDVHKQILSALQRKISAASQSSQYTK